MDDDHKNPVIIAFGLWCKKEEYLHWHDRTHSVKLSRLYNRDCIYYKNDVMREIAKWIARRCWFGKVVKSKAVNCSKTTMNDFCDFRNYIAGLGVFGQETKKATGL